VSQSQRGLALTMKLFSSVKYFIAPSYSAENQELLRHLLNENGAQEAQTPADASHVITNSLRFEGWQDVPESTVVTTVCRWGPI